METKRDLKILFETKRLYIRPFELKDAADCFEFYGDAMVMKHIGNGRLWSTDKSDTTVIKEHIEYNQENYGLGYFAVCSKQFDSKVIGHTYIKFSDKDYQFSEYEMGFLLHKNFWMQGLGTELLVGLVYTAFEVKDLEQVVLLIHQYNIGSIKLAKKIGFQYLKSVYYQGIPNVNIFYMNKENFILLDMQGNFPSVGLYPLKDY